MRVDEAILCSLGWEFCQRQTPLLDRLFEIAGALLAFCVSGERFQFRGVDKLIAGRAGERGRVDSGAAARTDMTAVERHCSNGPMTTRGSAAVSRQARAIPKERPPKSGSAVHLVRWSPS